MLKKRTVSAGWALTIGLALVGFGLTILPYGSAERIAAFALLSVGIFGCGIATGIWLERNDERAQARTTTDVLPHFESQGDGSPRLPQPVVTPPAPETIEKVNVEPAAVYKTSVRGPFWRLLSQAAGRRIRGRAN